MPSKSETATGPAPKTQELAYAKAEDVDALRDEFKGHGHGPSDSLLNAVRGLLLVFESGSLNGAQRIAIAAVRVQLGDGDGT